MGFDNPLTIENYGNPVRGDHPRSLTMKKTYSLLTPGSKD